MKSCTQLDALKIEGIANGKVKNPPARNLKTGFHKPNPMETTSHAL